MSGQIFKKLAASFLSFGLVISSAGCAETKVPDINEKLFKNIAELSTVSVYLHNVAKTTKKAGNGFFNIGKVDRKYWVPYNYEIDLGIDTSKISSQKDGNTIRMTIPPAEILREEVTWVDEDGIVCSNDSWNRNEFSKEDQQKVIVDSRTEALLLFQKETDQFDRAQERAVELIQSYIDAVNAETGTNYEVAFHTIPYEVPEGVDEELRKLEEKRQELENE